MYFRNLSYFPYHYYGKNRENDFFKLISHHSTVPRMICYRTGSFLMAALFALELNPPPLACPLSSTKAPKPCAELSFIKNSITGGSCVLTSMYTVNGQVSSHLIIFK